MEDVQLRIAKAEGDIAAAEQHLAAADLSNEDKAYWRGKEAALRADLTELRKEKNLLLQQQGAGAWFRGVAVMQCAACGCCCVCWVLLQLLPT
jgi:hypothetical protein